MRRVAGIGIAAVAASVLAARIAVAEPPPAAPFDYARLPVFDDPRPSILTRPTMTAGPAPERASQFYPERALRHEVNGVAMITCKVTQAGLLTGCVLAYEAPLDMGFGSAMLKLAREYRFAPGTRDGAYDPDQTVSIVKNFTMVPGGPRPSPPPPEPVRASWNDPAQPAPPELAPAILPAGGLAAFGITPMGTIHFLSLDDMVPRGDVVEANWLEVGRETDPHLWQASPYRVGRVRIDCIKATVSYLGARFYDAAGGETGWVLGSPEPEAADASGPSGHIVALACGRADKGAVVQGAPAALAVVLGR